MKKYIFDIHYDMVIRGIEVMADSIGEAAQIAKDKAARLPMESAECVEQDAQLTEDPQELTRDEVREYYTLRYGRRGKSPYEAKVEGLSKERKKQTVTEAVEVLYSRMEYYVEHQDEEDCKVWEPQMIVRYDLGRDAHGHEDYWNLFVYCHGPNDQDGRDCYELATAWQHVHYDADGRDLCDDYSTEFHKSRADLLRTLFYKAAPQFDETDEEPTWQRIESVWVD